MRKSHASVLVAILLVMGVQPTRSHAQHVNPPTDLTPTMGAYLDAPPTFKFKSNDGLCYLLVVTNDSNKCQSNGTATDLVHKIGIVAPGNYASYTPTVAEWNILKNGPIYWHVDGSAYAGSNCPDLPYAAHSGQCIRLTKMADPLTLQQESIPAPVDSGTRLVRTAIRITSSSAFPAQLLVGVNASDISTPRQDSLFILADSIQLDVPGVMRDNPLKYEDSVYSGRFLSPFLNFVIPPHGTIRIPLLLHSLIAKNGQQTIDSIRYSFYGALVDTTFVGYHEFYGQPGCYLRLPAACVAPYDFGDSVFGSKLYSNEKAAVAVGEAPWSVGGHVPAQNYVNFADTLRVTLRVVGEHSDSFRLTWHDTTLTRLSDWSYGVVPGWIFSGAPKSVVHDTLITTSTDCYGSAVTRTPIDAYSIYKNGYAIGKLSGLMLPFLANAQSRVPVVNKSDFPITLRNVHASGYDSVDFDVSAPERIAAHDSDYISVRVTDRDVYADTLHPYISASISGIVAPYQQDFSFIDSAFSFSVLDTIDVYSPQYYGYYSAPSLKHGIHQEGIIFTSSVSSARAGAGTFISIYANHEATTEYFGVPYYDDPHFQISIVNYTGFGTSLPGYVKPDTGFLSPVIEAQTTFTGDSYHNYRTQLHWPRENDTATIDVIAVGDHAPPYSSVRNDPTPVVHIWPNPASNMLLVRSRDNHFNFSIFDALGRELRRDQSWSDIARIDISRLPPGMYELYIPEAQHTERFQVIR